MGSWNLAVAAANFQLMTTMILKVCLSLAFLTMVWCRAPSHPDYPGLIVWLCDAENGDWNYCMSWDEAQWCIRRFIKTEQYRLLGYMPSHQDFKWMSGDDKCLTV